MVNTDIKVNFTAAKVDIILNAFYESETQVFVMEDGSTPFIDETHTFEFKPEQ